MGAPRVQIGERAIASFIDSGARRIAPKFKTSTMREKYFAPRGSTTGDRCWVSSLDPPNFRESGFFPDNPMSKCEPYANQGKESTAAARGRSEVGEHDELRFLDIPSLCLTKFWVDINLAAGIVFRVSKKIDEQKLTDSHIRASTPRVAALASLPKLEA